jgi:drug/metabolite transporter (DMT)-like permease
MVLLAVPGLGLFLSTVTFHESLNLSLKLGILLIGAGIWIVTNAVVTPTRRPA